MKLKILSAFYLCFSLNAAFGQIHLSLSPQNPKNGDKVNIAFESAGSDLEKAPVVSAVALLFNKDAKAHAIDLRLVKDGSTWQTHIQLPDSIVLVALKFKGDINGTMTTDKSAPTGYFIDYTNADGKPLKGAMLSKAMVYQTYGPLVLGMDPMNELALSAVEKEYELYPVSRQKSASQYNMIIFAGKDSKRIEEQRKKLSEIFTDPKSTEEDLIVASRYLSIGNRKATDSLNSVIKSRYPQGKLAQAAVYASAFAKFMAEKDPLAKSAMYEGAKKSSPENNPYLTIMPTHLILDFAKNNDQANFYRYLPEVKNKSSLPAAFNNLAWSMAQKNENLDFAAKLSKMSLNILMAEREDTSESIKPISERLAGNRGFYRIYADTYAFILYKQGKYADALNYQKQAILTSGIQSAEIYERYALYLEKNRQYNEARETLEKYIKLGKATPAMKEQLEALYIRQKGSIDGFNEYYTAFESASKIKFHETLVKKMINVPAPLFSLKDFDGNIVSLAALKGKVVVIDFWATWCGPCKASFPGMQLAVDKYKEDPSVKFVFIDTWERVENSDVLARKYIADNNYTFQVLFDTEIKGNKGKYKIVDDYKVSGIPTKFVIDKAGNIRFKSVGYSGDPEALSREISEMIQLAANPPLAKEAKQ